MADLSSLSDAELMQIAGISPSGSSSADLSSLSDNELMMIAGIDAAPLTGKQKFAGGLANMIPLNVGDEIMAGIRTGADILQGKPMGPSYDANLAEIRQYERAFEAERPVMAAATSLAGNAPLLVAAPTAIGSRANIFTKLGQSAAEGAGWGAAYGFGGGEGMEDRLYDAGTQGAVGGVLSPAITGALGFGGWLTSIPGKTGDTLRALFRSPDDIAAGKLAPSAEKILSVADDAANPLSKYRTLAEATQDPYLAQLEQQLTKSTPLGNDLLNTNIGDRQKLQRSLVDALSEAPSRGAEEGGVAFRQLLEPEAEVTKKAAEAIFESINPGGKLPVKEIDRAFGKSLGKMYEAGGAPSSLIGIKQELTHAVSGPKQKEIESLLFDAYGRKIPPEAPTIPELTKPFSYLHSLRQRAQDAWTAAKNVGDNRAAATANGLVRKIDEVIESAGTSGAMSVSDVRRFGDAKKAFTEYSKTYQQGPVGIALRKMGETYQVPESSVPGMIFNGKAENTKKLLKALPDSAEGLEQARGLVRDRILRETSTNDRILSPGRFQTFLRKNREGLVAATDDGKRLFDVDHIDALDKVAEDLAFLDPQSIHSVNKLAHKASNGQPTTAQALILQDLADKGGNLIPWGGVAKKLVGGVLEKKTQQANDILVEAMFDKDLAKGLLLKATPERIGAISSFFNRASSGLGSASGRAPVLSGFVVDALAEYSPKTQPSSSDSSASSEYVRQLSRGSGSSESRSPVEQAVLSPSSYSSSVFDKEQSLSEPSVFAKVLDAVKLVESDGDPNAIGPETKYGRAKGAYQFLDSTGKEYHKKLGIKEPYDPHNEPQQRKLAAAYITDLLKMFDGDMELALTAFHTGPENVKKGKIGPIGRNYARSVFDKV